MIDKIKAVIGDTSPIANPRRKTTTNKKPVNVLMAYIEEMLISGPYLILLFISMIVSSLRSGISSLRVIPRAFRWASRHISRRAWTWVS